MDSSSLDKMVRALVASLSRSLAEQFNVFRVMHHGTHEKQLSNVFAWLLQADATHGLGDAFQRIFVEQVNRALPERGQLPTSGYRVEQEVDTSGHDSLGKDIADIVLESREARIVVENFESSDGHGHDYQGYLAYGAAGGRESVVVLLCARREPHRQSNGWEQAIVLTYAAVLRPLMAHIGADAAWQSAHRAQHVFLEQLAEYFMGGSEVISDAEQIAFMKTMCDTGESARYGRRPHLAAAEEFGELLAQHGKRQFEESRSMLARVKHALKRFAEQTLVVQVSQTVGRGVIDLADTRFVGQWEWCVALRQGAADPVAFLAFGPTAVAENDRAPDTIEHPDYTKVFVLRTVPGQDVVEHIVQTDVGLEEILAGLPADDERLCRAVVATMRLD